MRMENVFFGVGGQSQQEAKSNFFNLHSPFCGLLQRHVRLGGEKWREIRRRGGKMKNFSHESPSSLEDLLLFDIRYCVMNDPHVWGSFSISSNFEMFAFLFFVTYSLLTTHGTMAEKGKVEVGEVSFHFMPEIIGCCCRWCCWRGVGKGIISYRLFVEAYEYGSSGSWSRKERELCKHVRIEEGQGKFFKENTSSNGTMNRENIHMLEKVDLHMSKMDQNFKLKLHLRWVGAIFTHS